MYTPSVEWAYWFMRTKLSLRLYNCLVVEQALVKQDDRSTQHHVATIAVKLDSGLDRKYIIGSDEFGMCYAPFSQVRLEMGKNRSDRGEILEGR